MRLVDGLLGCSLGTLLLITDAVAQPAMEASAEAPAPEAPAYRADACSAAAPVQPRTGLSRSHGTTWSGSLEGGVFLSDSPTRYHVDEQQCAYWGVESLVGMVERAAGSVAAQWPGARLAVGEISLPEGGPLRGHASHQSGRDVDLGFYFVDQRGNTVEPGKLIDVRRNGTARLKRQLIRFDAARNWHLLNALLDDPETDLEIVLINTRIRTMLLNEARRQRVPRARRVEAARVMVVPRRWEHPHLNHFHVRIFCPEGSPRCEDGRPPWAWTVARREGRRGSDEEPWTGQEIGETGAALSPPPLE